MGVGQLHPRHGIQLTVRRTTGKERRVSGEQLWADDAAGLNAIVLDDYRSWIHGDAPEIDGMW